MSEEEKDAKIEQLQKEIEELKKENLEIRDWKYVIDSYEDLERLKELDLIKIKGKEYISKDKIRAFIKEELPDDEIMETCQMYIINGVLIREKLEKLLEEE